LASSAALLVALAEVFGVAGPPAAVASLCQEAEHLIGVPVGAMDPLVCAGGRRDHALLIDFSTMDTRPVPHPTGTDVVVVDSGHRRSLHEAPYAVRVEECRSAAVVVGPLGLADETDLAAISDPLLRRRGRHVITECRRVRDMVEAFGSDDLVAAGALMSESQRSLADDFEVSIPAVDMLVEQLVAMPGVLGSRLTGAGFGGCVVTLCHAGALDPAELDVPAWRVAAVDGTVARRSAYDPDAPPSA
jgi:galactokinase